MTGPVSVPFSFVVCFGCRFQLPRKMVVAWRKKDNDVQQHRLVTTLSDVETSREIEKERERKKLKERQ